MKKFLKFFIPLLVLLALAYQFRVTLSERVVPLWDLFKTQILRQAPCQEPIPYKIGTFDTKFGISKEYFLGALSDAETIWEKPKGEYSGANLFTYAPDDSSYNILAINLVYDYRQQATSKLSSLGITVENNKASYDALKVKFTALKAEYAKEKNDYDARVKAFNQGNKRDEAEFRSLELARQNLNNKVDEINALVVVLNRLAGTLNLAVDKYNTVNDSRGESFEEGVYISQGLSREIDIYEFSSRDKLVRVLAHELGHALGLPHVSDPKAIMYEFNQGNNQVLTAADLAALKTRCQFK